MSEKPWYKSKTKMGATLVGLSAVIGTIGGWLQGSIDPGTAITALIAEIGVVLAVFGVRDLPVVNKK
ncbi:MAG: hypothetical protein ABIJ14_00675 [Nanoarchaeota archaeon]